MMRHADSYFGLTGRAVTLWIRAIGLMLMVALLAWPVGSALADDEKPASARPTEKSDDNGEADDSAAADDEKSSEAEDSNGESKREAAKKKAGRRINPTNRSAQRLGSSLQPARPSKQPKPSPRRGRDREKDDSTTDSEDAASTAIDGASNFSFSDFELPAEERTYAFAFDDVDYGVVMNQWARMTGLPVLGDPPSGKVSYASAETLNYKTALGRINQLLFNHEKIYWMLRTEDNVFLVMLMSDVPRHLPVDRIKSSLEAFEAADLDDEEVAMLLYTPESGSVDDLQAIRDFMPDYMRTAPYRNSNSMTIFGKVIDIRKYLQLNDLFSSAGDDPRTPLQIPVQHITATKAVDLLEQMMDHGRSRGAAKPVRSSRSKGSDSMLSSGLSPAMLIPFDEQKLILVKAIQKQIDEIYRLLALIDLPKLGEFNPIVIPLEHARADELVSIIYPLADGGSPKRRTPSKKSGGETSSSPGLNIIPEPRTNSLIVIGDEEQIAKVYKLIDMFDVPERETYRIIDVMYVDAEELIATTKKLMGVRTSSKKTSSNFVMNPTPTGDSIIMSGPLQELDKAEQIVLALDLESTDEEPTLHQARLFNAKPSVVAEMLTGLDQLEDSDRSSGKGRTPAKKGTPKSRSGSTGGRFFSDDSSKTLFVMCTDQEWETKYQSRIQEFDRQAVPDTTLIEITYITPEEALTTLQQLFPPARAGKGKQSGGSNDVQFALTVGGLIVANATPAQIDKMRDVVAQIDVDPLADVTLITRIFDIEHADPTEVRALVETLVTQSSGSKASPRGRGSRRGKNKQSDGSTIAGQAPMRIAMVGNRMVISADANVMEEIEELIASVDLPDPENELRVYTFGSGTNVTSLSQELTNLFPDGTPRRKRGGGAKGQPAGTSVIRFIPQHVGRKLVVSAPPELFPEIEQAIEKLSPISDEVPLEWRIFTLEYADAAEVVALVDPILAAKMSELYEIGELAGATDGKAGNKKRRGRQDGKLTIMPDATGGRIVVLAPSILMAEAEALITAFDVEDALEDTVIRIVRVHSTSAEEMGEIIRAMISGQAPSPTPKRSRRGAEEKGRPRGIVISGPMKVMVVAAPGGRSLVLSGEPRDVDEVEAWIHELDEESEGIHTFKVYQVTYSDPWELAETIMAFIDSGRGSGPKGADRNKNQDSLLGGFFEDFMPKSGPMIGREVIINVDSGSGTLVVQASPSKLRIVDELMELYEGTDDTAPVIDLNVAPTPTLLYDLQHADAFDAVWTLQDYLSVLWNHPEPLPIVEEIPFTDTLVIKTNPKYFDEIKALIVERIDMEGADKSPTRVEWRMIDGAIASEVALKLKEQLVGFDVDIEVSGLDMKGLEELIPPVQPYIPAKDSIEEDAFCVLPLCVTTAWNGLVSAASGQTAAGGDRDSELTEEEIRQILLKGSADNSSQVSDESDLLTEREDEADDESDEPQPKPKVRIRIDDKTGALVVEGPDDIVQEVMYKLDDILEDIKEHPGRPDIRVYQLRYVDVDWAAQALDAMFNLKKASKTNSAAIQQQIKQLEAKQKAAGARGGKGADPKAATADQQKLEALRAQLASASQPSNIFVYPIPRNQSLGIRAKTGDFPAIVEFLATIDRPGETTFEFKIFELVNRKAEEVEQMVKLLLGLDKPVSKSRAPTSGKPNPQQQQIQQLQDQLSQLTGGGDGLAARPDQIKITSDALTNTIFVLAPRQVIPMIEKLIYQIEDQSMPQRVIEIFALVNADATEVVGHLKELFPGTGRSRGSKKGGATPEGRDPLTVNAPVFMAVTRTNTVFVQALDVDIDKIEVEIKRLDEHTEGDAVVVVKIKWGNPDSIARTLQQAFEDRSGGGRKGGGGRGASLKIIADADSNSVFIRGAAPSMLEEIQNLIASMDTSEGTQPRPIKIAEGTPTEIAQIVESVYGGGRGGKGGKRGSGGSVKVIGADASGQLFVIAPDDLFTDIEVLVRTLDVPSGFAATVTRVYPIQHADPSGVVQAINGLSPRGGRGRGANEDRIAATVERRTSSVIVTASDENQERIAELIAEVDVEGLNPRRTHVIKLKEADAEEVARGFQQFLRATRRNLRSGEIPMQVYADPGTNSLVVYATDEELAEIQSLLLVVDVKPEWMEKRQIKSFNLIHAEAWGVKGMIDEMFRSRGRNSSPADQVTSMADGGSNALVVSASRNNMEQIEKLIAEVDKKDASQREVHVVQADHADSVARALTEAFGARRRGGQQTVTITNPPGTDSLLIKANETEFAEILVVLNELESVSAEIGGDVRVIRLEKSDAEELQSVVQEILRQPGSRSRRGGELAGDIRVSVIPSANALIISGETDELDRIEPMIRDLDFQTVGSEAEIIRLVNVDPSRIEPILTRMYGDSRGRSRGRGEDVPVIVADDMSKTLLVYASPMVFNKIEALVAKLDTPDTGVASGVKIIRVQAGINVSDLAATLDSLLAESSRYEAEALGIPRKQVAITADVRTNTIIVAGAPSRFAEVEQLVRTLESMGPAGGRKTIILKVNTMNPEDLKRVIEQMSEESSSSSSRSSRRRR